MNDARAYLNDKQIQACEAKNIAYVAIHKDSHDIQAFTENEARNGRLIVCPGLSIDMYRDHDWLVLKFDCEIQANG